MEQGGKVTEEEVETEQEDAGVWFARVWIGPQPRALRALSHLCQVGRGVVGDEEEAGEMMAGRRPDIRQYIWQQGERRDGCGEAEGKAWPPPPAGGRPAGLPGSWGSSRQRGGRKRRRGPKTSGIHNTKKSAERGGGVAETRRPTNGTDGG